MSEKCRKNPCQHDPAQIVSVSGLLLPNDWRIRSVTHLPRLSRKVTRILGRFFFAPTKSTATPIRAGVCV